MIFRGIRLRTGLRFSAASGLAVAALFATFGCGSSSSTYSPVVKGGAPPSFTLAVTPASATTIQGGSATYTVTITDANGFNSAIALSTSGLPTGASASFSAITPTATGGTSTLTVTTSDTEEEAAIVAKSAKPVVATGAKTRQVTPTGSTTFTVSGTGGGVTATATATLVVNTAITPDFTIAVNPTSANIETGGAYNYVVVITSVGGFDATTVTLANPTPLPSEASAQLSVVKNTAAEKDIQMSISTLGDGTTSPGTYPLTVSASGSGVTHSASFTMNVYSFTVTVSPAAPQTVAAGETQNYTVTVTSVGNFPSSGVVTLTASSFDLPSGNPITFSQANVTPTPSGTVTTMSIKTSGQVPNGSYHITIIGTSGTLSTDVHNAFVTLTTFQS